MQTTSGRILIALALAPAIASAQRTPPDSARADTARIADVRVSVTRIQDEALRLPWALGVQTSDDIRGARPTLSADEALNNIPGVFVSNRHIYALDQVRLSVRGAGARANFGARGVKVLLDGVPQTLPDGQSQMTNIELGNIGRIEVLRGASSSLYGNGSGGVVSFETDLNAPDRLQQDLRAVVGDFGMKKWQFRTIGRGSRALGSLSISSTETDGFRQYSSAEVRQINGAMNYALGSATTLELRAHNTHMPQALNPGALTEAEWRANPDSAVPTNILRGAGKEITQRQVSLGLRHNDGGAMSWRAVGFFSTRSVDNPLAAQPPPPRTVQTGTLVTLDRTIAGGRADYELRFGAGPRPAHFNTGLDVQWFSDERRNRRTTLGGISAVNDTIIVDQVESVVAVGPFAQLTWSPMESATLSAGVRWDYHRFEAEDRHLTDGFDDSGQRTMSATSGHVGASFVAHPMFVPYATFATAFETPTTTEMQVRSTGLGGFNDDLQPQTTRTVEIGVRGASDWLRYELAAFRGMTGDALIQYAADNDRTFFRNAGSLTSLGAEVGVSLLPVSWFHTSLAYTFAQHEFDEYRIPGDDGVTILDGNKLAGVPAHFIRAGVGASAGGLALDADWTWSASVFADDANTVRIDDWGAGRLDLRLMWTLTSRGQRFAPFVGVGNVLDEVYVGSVTLNGFGGRYFESAPRRHIYGGVELGWSVLQ